MCSNNKQISGSGHEKVTKRMIMTMMMMKDHYLTVAEVNGDDDDNDKYFISSRGRW